MNQEWHSSKEFNKKIVDYHNKFARQPNVAEPKAKLELLKEEIRQQMDSQGLFKCMGFSYKGSTYEGVKIIKSDADCPEFDLDFIVRGGEFLVAGSSENGWHELQVKQDKPHNLPILDKAQVDGKIPPDRVMQLFYGSLTKCEFITKYNVKLRYHGPAVQLDVHHQNTNNLWFQVDLAPAFYLEGTNPTERFSDCYVAKSPDDVSLKNMWYRSYSSDEKRIMDKASGQRKVVLRTLKNDASYEPDDQNYDDDDSDDDDDNGGAGDDDVNVNSHHNNDNHLPPVPPRSFKSLSDKTHPVAPTSSIQADAKKEDQVSHQNGTLPNSSNQESHVTKDDTTKGINSDPQDVMKRRKHEERVKKTRETLERMRMKQQECESAKQDSQFGFLFYGGLSLAVAFLGFAAYKVMSDST